MKSKTDPVRDHSDKEERKMRKDRTSEDMIRILQEDIEIPQIVQKKADAAFRQIRVEAAAERKTGTDMPQKMQMNTIEGRKQWENRERRQMTGAGEKTQTAGNAGMENRDTCWSEKRGDTGMRKCERENTAQRKRSRKKTEKFAPYLADRCSGSLPDCRAWGRRSSIQQLEPKCGKGNAGDTKAA